MEWAGVWMECAGVWMGRTGVSGDRPARGTSGVVTPGPVAKSADPSKSRDVDVVVVAYGAADLLERCLAPLAGRLPLLVVDNSSDPAVEAVAKRHGATYIDPGRNLGFGAGRERRPGPPGLLRAPTTYCS